MMQKHAFLAALTSATMALGQGTLLPPAPGPYDVTLRTTELHDYTRNETYAPNADHRRIMVSIFSPIPKGSESCQTAYMPRAVADHEAQSYGSLPEPDTIDINLKLFKQRICSRDVTHGHPDQTIHQNTAQNTTSFPVVFFSPGHGGPRFWYHLIVQHFASYGYIVVLMDHPGDGSIVEFPDGSVIFYSRDTSVDIEHIERNLLVRTADASFVLNQMTSNCTLRSLVLSPHARAESFERVGIWGQSFGGDTAVSAVLEDERFQGAIEMDGALYGRVRRDGFDRPVLFIGAEDSETWPSVSWKNWVPAWPLIRGYKQLLKVKGALHYGLMDTRLVADLAQVEAPMLGSIDGLRQITMLNAYARDFFEFVLHGEDLGLLKGPSKEYPEMLFLTQPV